MTILVSVFPAGMPHVCFSLCVCSTAPAVVLADVLEPALARLVATTSGIQERSPLLWPPKNAKALGALLMEVKGSYMDRDHRPAAV